MAKRENKLRGSYRNIVQLPITPQNYQDGNKFYPDAYMIAYSIGEIAGCEWDKRAKVGAGILSALSPQVDWGQNVEWAVLLAKTRTRKQTTVQHNKAIAILDGAEPLEVLGERAWKTIAFYKAILKPNHADEPVVDRHALSVYMGREGTEKERKLLNNPYLFVRIQKAYMRASKELGMNVHVLQASTWLQWRENKGIISRQ